MIGVTPKITSLKKSVTFVTLGFDNNPPLFQESVTKKTIHFGGKQFFPLKSPQNYEKSAKKWVKKAEKSSKKSVKQMLQSRICTLFNTQPNYL